MSEAKRPPILTVYEVLDAREGRLAGIFYRNGYIDKVTGHLFLAWPCRERGTCARTIRRKNEREFRFRVRITVRGKTNG